MRDTAAVLAALDRSKSNTKLLTIVHERGAQTACAHAAVDYMGFPFSISENFQMAQRKQLRSPRWFWNGY